MKLGCGKVSAIGVSGCDSALFISGAAWTDLRHRPTDIGESTGSSKPFEYNLKLYLAFWLKENAYSWVGMLWLHHFRKLFDLSEVTEDNWEVVGSYILILDMALYTCDVGEACFIALCGYLRYLGIVRTMPTYLIWGTPAVWGQCLRTLFEILRYCIDNAYVSPLTSGYFIWKSTL